MIDYSSPYYVDVIDMIHQRMIEGESLESIKQIDEKGLKAICGYMSCEIPSIEDWRNLVDYVHKRYFEGFSTNPEGPDLTKLPDWPKSSWRAFIEGLKGQEAELTSILKKDVLSITSKLRWETKDTANRGLVIGDARSSKTLNILGLVNTVFDYGWNIVIYLMGRSSYVLNSQSKRLDEGVFTGQQEFSTTISELGHTHLLPQGNRLDFEKDPNRRFLLFGLKNNNNLKALEGWLNCSDRIRSTMRVLIIEERDIRSAAEGQIAVDSTEDLTLSGILKAGVGQSPLASINYVVYTSACYDTLLKKSILTSMIPIDFSVILSRGSKYLSTDDLFPPEEGPEIGLDGFVVADNGVDKGLIKLYSDPDRNPPKALREAVAWALCANAISNYHQGQDPCTMLISCDVMDVHVTSLTKAVFAILEDEELLTLCEEIYCRMTPRVSLESYLTRFPTMRKDIRDYPSFEEISPLIKKALSQGPYRHEDVQKGKKHDGIIVCYDTGRVEDNYKNYCPDQYIEYVTDYRNKIKYKGHAPLYILIAFRNISRGLEIRRLVSTYLAKTTDKRDPNIPMGTWSGRHRGYELLQRIWMSEETKEYYVKLNRVERDTRSYIESHGIRRPTDLPERLRNSLETIRFNKISYTLTNKKTVCAKCGRTILEGEVCYAIQGPFESWRCYDCQFPMTHQMRDARRKKEKDAEKVIPWLLSARMVSAKELESKTGQKITILTNQLQEMGYVTRSLKKGQKKFESTSLDGVYFQLICCPELFEFFRKLERSLNSTDQDALEGLYNDYENSWIWMFERLYEDIIGKESPFDIADERGDYTYCNYGFAYFKRSCERIKEQYMGLLTGDRLKFHYANQAKWVNEELDRKNRYTVLQNTIMRILGRMEGIQIIGKDEMSIDGRRIQVSVQSETDRVRSGVSRREGLLNIFVGKGRVTCIEMDSEKRFEEYFPQTTEKIRRELRTMVRIIDRGF